MSFEADFQQFLADLPRQLFQARRQAFSNNLNMLEFWNRRLQDFSHVISVFIRRCEDARATPEILCAYLREVLLEISNLQDLVENNILIDEAYIADMSIDFIGCPEEHEEGAFGRPRKLVEKEEIENLFQVYNSWQKVAELLGISDKTLRRRRHEYGMNVAGTSGPRSTYTSISNEDLCTVISDALRILPNAGESYIIGACRSKGLQVQRWHIREAISTVDPVSRALRRTTSIIRRTYSVPAPNSLWYALCLFEMLV